MDTDFFGEGSTSAAMGWGQDRERILDQGYCQKR
jgi:hypothetical protein